MLLRNLDPPKLCNGTKLVVKSLHRHVIEATILNGTSAGEEVFIPRIPMIPNDLPFRFKRLQFPVRTCFAMSINKSQGEINVYIRSSFLLMIMLFSGQTLKVAGLQLTEPCFSHGQLYVACSRVGSRKSLFVLAPKNRTKNIVYPAALR